MSTPKKEKTVKYEGLTEEQLNAEGVRLQKIIDENEEIIAAKSKIRNEAAADFRSVHSRLTTINMRKAATKKA